MAKTVTKPKKKAAKKKTRKKAAPKVTWNPDKKLTDKEELFCRFYVQNDETRMNGTQSYNLAYGKKLEEKSTEDAVWAKRPTKDGESMEDYCIEKSSYDKCQAVCATESYRLLIKPYIERRKVELLNEMLTNEMVDAELTKVIKQDGDRPSKVRAINEFNKLGGRIVTKEAHTHAFSNETMSDAELLARIAENKKFFNKE